MTALTPNPDRDEPEKARRSVRVSKRRRFGVLLLGFSLIAGITALALIKRDHVILAYDEMMIYAHKLDRRISFAVGRPLSGTPDLARLDGRLSEKGLKLGAPVFIRIFKQEFELEMWMQKGDRFVLFATYPICTYSGALGPKLKQGDKQAPEGFYTVSRAQLNPNSRWHRSFNLGYPNVLEAAHGRTGDFLMVHGGCASIGCYAMTNPVIDEIWSLITAALNAGQERFGVHAFPFRMNDWRLEAHSASRWVPFWRDLKQAHDLFEASQIPPEITVCRNTYAVQPGAAGYDGAKALRSACPPAAGTSS